MSKKQAGDIFPAQDRPKPLELSRMTKTQGLFRSWDDSVEDVVLLSDPITGEKYVQFEDGAIYNRDAFEGVRTDPSGKKIDDGEIVELSLTAKNYRPMIRRVASAFLDEMLCREAGTAIRSLLEIAKTRKPREKKERAPGETERKEGPYEKFLTSDNLEKAKAELANPQYQKLITNVPEKTRRAVESFFIWQLMKDKASLDHFIQKHPDFLAKADTAKTDIQKIFTQVKDGDTTMEDVEKIIYPEISSFKETDFKKSINPHFKELNVPGMPSGQKWVIITDETGNPVSECRGEAGAMGHCGRSYGGELLSLRDVQGRSHITVDRRPPGELIQLKFQGNRILRENLNKFRPYTQAIKALLMSDEITSVPQHELQDISVLDLMTEHDSSFLKEVMAKKPSLISNREKDVLLPIYEKSWKGELNMDELIDNLAL